MAVLATALLAACAAGPSAPPTGPAVPASPSPAPAVVAPVMPEAASGFTARTGTSHTRQAVAAAHPLAAQAGLDALRAGGSAVDAAIAVQLVLGLVEPQSSGIGGGAFLLHFDGRRVVAYDGRETAPAAATERLFLDDAGQPLPYPQAVVSGRAVGVPGAVAVLALAHRDHGHLPWVQLFEPAIRLAREGFPVSARLHTLLSNDPALRNDPVARAYFYRPDGSPHPVGHRLRNPEYAEVLRQIALLGPRALQDGPVARAIVAAVQREPLPGGLTLTDLRSYQPMRRPPLCHRHQASGRELRICGFPPPSSGGLAVGQTLGLLARTPAAGWPLQDGLPGAEWLHFFNEASRLAMADRAQYVADPDFVPAPAGRWGSLLDADYLDQRARLIGPQRAPQVGPGRPGQTTLSWAPMPEQPEWGTSHVSVVDARGRMVAMTTTVEAAFGSRRMVTTNPSRPGGFLLNNELTDFSFSPRDAQGLPVANRVEPGKRPRSSMSPTLVFDARTAEPLMTTGSAGGPFIIPYTAKMLHGVLQWGLHPQAAADLPNFGTLGGPLLLEPDRFSATTLDTLRQRGHTVQQTDLTSGSQALVQREGRWLGGADPRREGEVRGD